MYHYHHIKSNTSQNMKTILYQIRPSIFRFRHQGVEKCFRSVPLSRPLECCRYTNLHSLYAGLFHHCATISSRDSLWSGFIWRNLFRRNLFRRTLIRRTLSRRCCIGCFHGNLFIFGSSLRLHRRFFVFIFILCASLQRHSLHFTQFLAPLPPEERSRTNHEERHNWRKNKS